MLYYYYYYLYLHRRRECWTLEIDNDCVHNYRNTIDYFMNETVFALRRRQRLQTGYAALRSTKFTCFHCDMHLVQTL